jgi:hypothetical protein
LRKRNRRAVMEIRKTAGYSLKKEMRTRVINGTTYQFSHTHRDSTPDAGGSCTISVHRQEKVRYPQQISPQPSWTQVQVHYLTRSWQHGDVPGAPAMSRRVADLLTRCLRSLVDEGIGPARYEADDGGVTGSRSDDALFLAAADIVGQEKVRSREWSLGARLDAMARSLQDDGTVDGIRPHLPLSELGDFRARRTADTGVQDCPFCYQGPVADLRDHIRNCHPFSFLSGRDQQL